jgi:hypothetical protein
MVARATSRNHFLYARPEIVVCRGVERFADYKKAKARIRRALDTGIDADASWGWKRRWRSLASAKGLAMITAIGTLVLVALGVATLIVLLLLRSAVPMTGCCRAAPMPGRITKCSRSCTSSPSPDEREALATNITVALAAIRMGRGGAPADRAPAVPVVVSVAMRKWFWRTCSDGFSRRVGRVFGAGRVWRGRTSVF